MGPGQALLHAAAGLLGMHPSPGERVRLVFQHFPPGGLGMLSVLGLLLLFLLGFWSLEGLGRDRPAWARIAAGLARGVVLALPLFLLLGPALVLEKENKIRGTTFVLVDTSWSMNQKDPGSRASREAGVLRFLKAGNPSFLERLAGKNRVRLLAFDRTVRPLSLPAGKAPPGKARGKATNLAAALEAVLEGESAGRVAGAVIFTDGRWNEGGDPSRKARIFAARKIPLHLVGVGSPSTPPSLRLSAREAPERAFLGDPFTLRFRLQAPPGLARVRAVLSDALPGKEARVLREKTLSPGSSGEALLEFRVRPKEPGVHVFTLRVSSHPPGAALEARERIVVEVGTLPARVLLLAGGPTWEYRKLRRLFTRDPTIDLSCWLQSASPGYPQEGNHPITELPSREEDFRPYHAVLLLDPDPGRLNLLFAANLEKAVRRGGTGLLYQAGEIYSLKFFSEAVKAASTAPLVELLPARADQSVAEVLVGMGKPMTRSWPLEPTQAGLKDRILALGNSPEETRRIWTSLPGLYWNYPFRSPAPGAHVLLVHPGSGPLHRGPGGKRPILAWEYAGAGRSALLAVDSTWRWAAASEKAWERFWVRLVRFLAEPKLLGDRTLHQLFTDKNSYETGTEVLLADRPPKGWSGKTLEVEIRKDGGESFQVTLRPDPAGGGEIQARFSAGEPGIYEARLPGGKKCRPARFTVRPPALELFGPPAVETLKNLARLAGGTYRPLARASSLADTLEEASEIVVTQSPPRSIWDNWGFLLLAVLLLSVEWILRKWMNLP